MNIIAYGSLMNQNSLEGTLKRSAELTKIIIPNVQRIFNAPFGEYAFLNLISAEAGEIEAAFFTLEKREIKNFTEREKGSKLLEVLPGYYAFVWPDAYCKELPVLQSYIDTCESGSRDLGIDMWQGTRAPKLIINDSKNPRYP